MTIQLSVLIWTVICFCLFIFILNRFLFKPILAFMDQRQEKIDRAVRKKEENARALEEAQKELVAFHAAETKHLAGLINVEISRARQAADILVQETHTQRDLDVETCRAGLSREAEQIEETMNASVDALAKAYISTLVS